VTGKKFRSAAIFLRGIKHGFVRNHPSFAGSEFAGLSLSAP
jgi:hypothetical protein